jgi:hypothetical protein
VSIADGFVRVYQDGDHIGRHLIQAQRKAPAAAVVVDD